MTGWMVRIRDADLRIRAIALLARELERNDARDIRLEGQNLQVEHELGVVGERRGDPYRPIHIGVLVVRHCLLGTLNLTLDLTNTVEILVQAHAVGTPQASLELRDARIE